MVEETVEVSSVPAVYRHLSEHPCNCGGEWKVVDRQSARDPVVVAVMVDHLSLACPRCNSEKQIAFRVDTSKPEYFGEAAAEAAEAASAMMAVATVAKFLEAKTEPDIHLRKRPSKKAKPKKKTPSVQLKTKSKAKKPAKKTSAKKPAPKKSAKQKSAKKRK
jgi:hypothetical protein